MSMDKGGAARAAIRINDSISRLNCDEDSNNIVLVGRKYTSNSLVRGIVPTKLGKLLFVLNNTFNNFSLIKYDFKTLFSNSIFGFDISNNQYVKECDIINLHWINGGGLSYRSLKRLSKLNKPIVWTLHDMWPFTGGCHYDEECGKYKEICGKCKVLNSKKERDLAKRNQYKKYKLFKEMDLTIVGCSNWITNCAKESYILRDKECLNIPNTLDLNIYKSIDKDIAKSILNISTNKKIVLFGAMSSTSDERKGFKYLIEAVKNLNKEEYIAVIFGNKERNMEIERYLDVIYLGELSDDYSLILAYNCADVFIAPSKQENLANTVMESLACGTPVVAFNIGGMSDMIKHQYNGYLAKAFNYKEICIGIKYCIDNRKLLSENAIRYVKEKYNYKEIGNRYLHLYKQLIKGERNIYD